MTSSLKGIVDNLSMTYGGNMLASVSDSAPAPSVTGSADFRDGASMAVEYTYDRNGNMTSDLNRKVSLISYNRQNRPARMRHAGGTETFTYLPDGTKRGRTVLGKDRSLSRTEYRGNLVCADDTLKYILFPGPRRSRSLPRLSRDAPRRCRTSCRWRRPCRTGNNGSPAQLFRSIWRRP